MPLPENNTAWPPAPWDFAYSQWKSNEAWFTDDVALLQQVYQTGGDVVRPTHRVRGREYSGGIVGTAKRMFWGRPVPVGQNRTRMHVPSASDLSMLSADLTVGEPATFMLGEGNGDEKAQKRLEKISSSPLARATSLQGAELASAYGCSVLTTTWDTEAEDHAWTKVSGADVAVPEFRNGRLIAVTLWSEYLDGQTVWRHLERHQIGAIVYGLYKGTANNLGIAHPLEDRPETKHLARLVDGDGGIPTNIKRLTASLWLNKDTRQWRKKGDLAYVGRSDYSGSMMELFDGLDEAWTSWMRDLRLGKARLVVPRAYLETDGPGGGTSFDDDQEIYSPINTPGVVREAGITQVQFAIRVEEHERTTRALFRKILASAGYIDLDEEDRERITTATGVQDGTRAKERTRDQKQLWAKLALQRQSSVALEIDGIVFPGKGGGLFEPPTVEFPKVSQEDPEKKARTIQVLRAASVVSIETGVRMRDPELGDPEVAAEVARIMRETGRQVPDPAKLDRTDPTQAELARAADKITNTKE